MKLLQKAYVAAEPLPGIGAQYKALSAAVLRWMKMKMCTATSQVSMSVIHLISPLSVPLVVNGSIPSALGWSHTHYPAILKNASDSTGNVLKASNKQFSSLLQRTCLVHF